VQAAFLILIRVCTIQQHGCACTSACAFLARSMHAFRQVLWAPCIVGVYVKQVLWTSAYTFAYTLATGCAYALMYVQFVHPALGNEGGGVQPVYEGTCCLVWGLSFDRRRDRGLSVSSLFLSRVGVYVGVGVCISTHTHTIHIWGPQMWAQGSIRHLKGPKNADGPNLSIFVFKYVYKVHIGIYVLGGGELEWDLRVTLLCSLT